jgi:heptosyltransferase-3
VSKVIPDYRRILIIATRQIGDVLCTTPLMRRARELWPNATIDVLGYEKTMGMLAGNSDINEVIESSEHPKWPEYRQLVRRIFRRYDLAIVTQPSDRAHIYGLLAAPTRVGIVPNSRSHNWWKKLLSAHTVELDYWKQHVVIERLSLINPFNSLSNRNEPQSVASLVPPTTEALPPNILDFLGSDPYVVFHATPMWRFKRWPSHNWAQLADHMAQSGYKVILSGSSSQQDRDLNAQIIDSVPTERVTKVFDASGLLNFGQLTTLLAQAHRYVGVDTSITHLAAAVGTPTVALFGATSPPNFGPWPKEGKFVKTQQSIWLLRGEMGLDKSLRQSRGNVTLVQGPGECVPCRKAGCMDKFESHSDCLDQLSVQSVIGAIAL